MRRRRRFGRRARIWLRSRLRRLDRHTPAWVQGLTPYGSSLTLHGLLLLILAIAFVVERREHDPWAAALEGSFAGQLVDDLTTLAPGERSGDPFTHLDSDEPPSLSIEPLNPDPAVSALPEVAPTVAIGPQLRLASRAAASLAPNLAEAVGSGGTLELATTPFSGRQGPVRAKLLRREGGSVESEKAVERGLDWIARHQNPDGSWSLDTHERCKGKPCPISPAGASDTGATGLAILPLLGAGHSPNEPGRYQRALELGLAWLAVHQDEKGNRFSGGGQESYAMYSHAIGTMALCEAYGVTRDERYREPATRAVAFTVSAQSSADGGWRYFPGQPGDTSVLGWQMLSLRSAHLAGLEVPERTLTRAVEFLDRAAADPKATTYSYLPGGRPSVVMTAEGLLIRQYLGWPRDHPALLAGSEIVARDLLTTDDRNIYYWYYAMQFLHNTRGKEWHRANPRVRDLIARQQVISKGCDRGSWDPMRPGVDRWGGKTGRLYQTSLSLLTLEVYYRYLPLYRDAGTAAPR